MKPKFDVGDRVVIVDRPFIDCPFVWVDEMNRLCGKEAIVRHASWDNLRNTHVYKIVDSEYAWCENCFIPIAEEQDFDVACTEEIEKLFCK